jgi:hypothetical protein
MTAGSRAGHPDADTRPRITRRAATPQRRHMGPRSSRRHHERLPNSITDPSSRRSDTTTGVGPSPLTPVGSPFVGPDVTAPTEERRTEPTPVHDSRQRRREPSVRTPVLGPTPDSGHLLGSQRASGSCIGTHRVPVDTGAWCRGRPAACRRRARPERREGARTIATIRSPQAGCVVTCWADGRAPREPGHHLSQVMAPRRASRPTDRRTIVSSSPAGDELSDSPRSHGGREDVWTRRRCR